MRAGRVSEAGRAYLITTVTHRRERWFSSFAAGCFMSRRIAAADAWPGADIHAWVLMPDHIHVLLSLTGSTRLPALLNSFKGRSAFAFNRWRGRSGPLWLDGFHDRAVRREESLADVARYIIANPVRAGLAGGVAGYPFWDCEWTGPEGIGV